MASPHRFNEAGAVPLRKSPEAYFIELLEKAASMRPERFRSGNLHIRIEELLPW